MLESWIYRSKFTNFELHEAGREDIVKLTIRYTVPSLGFTEYVLNRVSNPIMNAS